MHTLIKCYIYFLNLAIYFRYERLYEIGNAIELTVNLVAYNHGNYKC